MLSAKKFAYIFLGIAAMTLLMAVGVSALPPTGPTADAGGPYDVDERRAIRLDGSGTTHPSQNPATLTYEWDLDNDGGYDDATGINPIFNAGDLDGPTSVTVGLKVTDSNMESSTATATVTVNNEEPTFTGADVPSFIGPGSSATITIYAIDVPGDPLTWEFDCDNDGTYEVGPQASNSVTCTFETQGNNRVVIRVTDDEAARGWPSSSSGL